MPNWSSCTAVFATSLDAIQDHSLIVLLLRLLVMHTFLRIDLVDFIEQWRIHLSSRLNLVVSDQSCTILLSLATKESELICTAHTTRWRMELTLTYIIFSRRPCRKRRRADKAAQMHRESTVFWLRKEFYCYH